MGSNSIVELAKRIAEGLASEADVREYLRLVNLLERSDEYAKLPASEREVIAKELAQRVRVAIGKRDDEKGRVKKLNRFKRYVPIAVAMAFFLLAGIYFYHSVFRTNTQSSDLLTADKVSLKLPDGQEILLSNDKEGVAITADVNYLDGEPIRKTTDQSARITSFDLNTPKGVSYHLQLPDGSRVWVGAGTRLEYTDKDTLRAVKLTGEAYFEIAKMKDKPFEVSFTNNRVRVLGTSFNVESFPDQNFSRTTLVEGSVSIRNSNESLHLRPGEQAISKSDGIDKKKVNVSDFVAWKDGIINFNDDQLRDIMRRISNWYDVEAVFTSGNPDLRFGGSVSGDGPLEDALKVLEMTGKVSFDVSRNEKKVFVQSARIKDK